MLTHSTTQFEQSEGITGAQVAPTPIPVPYKDLNYANIVAGHNGISTIAGVHTQSGTQLGVSQILAAKLAIATGPGVQSFTLNKMLVGTTLATHNADFVPPVSSNILFTGYKAAGGAPVTQMYNFNCGDAAGVLLFGVAFMQEVAFSGFTDLGSLDITVSSLNTTHPSGTTLTSGANSVVVSVDTVISRLIRLRILLRSRGLVKDSQPTVTLLRVNFSI